MPHFLLSLLSHRARLRLLLGVQLAAAVPCLAQQAVIPLYPGPAPGSEHWNWEEGETVNTPMKLRIIYNVTRPTLSLYRPDTPNGTAVLLLPGGGMYVLNIDHEGHTLARRLVQKGFTVFVLKYRTGRILSEDPWQEVMANLRDTAQFRRKLEGIRPLAMADASAAIRYVRSHAEDLGIDPKRVGVAGFSAGGSIALGLCTTQEAQDRPDFAGLMYTVYHPPAGGALPATVPPAFIAAATDDALSSPTNSTAMYEAWIRTKQPAELHIYAKGGHGLRGGVSAGSWWMRFEEWLKEIGMVK